jgi:hypothetical protein
MCIACISGVEVVIANGAAAVGMAKGVATRGLDLRSPDRKSRRECAAWRANAAFLREIGLDPEAVLGPPPVGTGGGPDAPVSA